MRRIRSQRARKNRKSSTIATKTGGRRMSQRRGGTSGTVSRRTRRDVDESSKNKDISRSDYGFIEPDRGRKSSSRRETEMDYDRGAGGGEQAIDKPPRGKNVGRPDDLASAEEDEIEGGVERNAESMAGESEVQDVESEDIDEGDEEARGGIVKPDQEEDEELQRRRKGRDRGEPRTNPPE